MPAQGIIEGKLTVRHSITVDSKEMEDGALSVLSHICGTGIVKWI